MLALRIALRYLFAKKSHAAVIFSSEAILPLSISYL